MQNTNRWRSNQFQRAHIWNPWSNKTDAHLEVSACTVRVLLFFPIWEVLQNCSTFLHVSFSHGWKSVKNLRELREFLIHKIRTLECHANGHPKPKIKWLREDKGNFTVYDRNNKRMIGKHVRAGIKRDSTVPHTWNVSKVCLKGLRGKDS